MSSPDGIELDALISAAEALVAKDRERHRRDLYEAME